MMTSTPPPSTEGLSHRGGVAACSRMSDSRCSITDLTLEQALIRIKEIEDENRAHRDNLREHNAKMREQCEDLALWKRREQEKFEQTKALITALRADNQDMQVQIMTYKDKEKETSAQLAAVTQEKSHLMRQKAISEQRIFNLIKQAEELGVKGLVPDADDDSEAGAVSDNIVFVSTSEKEAEIAKLEAAVASKDESIAQLRANLLKKEKDLESQRDTTKQLLKDMQNQQRLKCTIEEENRSLTQQLMEAERLRHQHMQSVMANTRREMQAPLQTSLDGKLPHLVTESSTAQAQGSAPVVVSYPDNPEDIMSTLQSLNAEKQKEQMKKDLERKVEEGQQAREKLQRTVDSLERQLKELQHEVDQEKTRANEIQIHANKDLEALTRQYEEKLREVVQQTKEHDNQSMRAATTGDVSILRSQVLSLIKEVDEINTRNSALTATLHLKDDRIKELEEGKGSLVSERGQLHEEKLRLIQTLHSLHLQQEQAQHENTKIKSEYQNLQDSFSQLVTDYKELEEMFETHRNEAQQLSSQYLSYRQQTEEKLSKNKNTPKQMMEEINRLTAQVIAAEEAMRCKDEELVRLQSVEEYLQVYRIQADQYQRDFTDERESRVKLAGEKASLMEELNGLKEQNRQLKEENNLQNLQNLHNMQARHSGMHNLPHGGTLQYPHPYGNPRMMMSPSPSGGGIVPTSGAATMPTYAPTPPPPPPPQANRYPPPTFQEATGGMRPAATMLGVAGAGEESLSSFRQYECPKCRVQFPDEDTVQLHVTECLERD